MNHHFIPSSYLERWKNKNFQKIIYYSKPYKEIIAGELGACSLCCEEDLYARTNSPEKIKQNLETTVYSPIDDKAAKVIAKIIENGPNKLNRNEKEDFGRFLHSLGARHKLQIKKFRTNDSKLTFNVPNKLKPKYEADYEEIKKDIPILIIEKFFSAENGPGLDSLSKFNSALLSLTWWIEDFSSTQLTLLTSDYPFILLAKDESAIDFIKEQLKLGNPSLPDLLLSGKFIAFFPLSPTKGFFAAPIKPHWPDKIKVIQMLNIEIAERAMLYVIAQDKTQEEMIKKHFTPSNQVE